MSFLLGKNKEIVASTHRIDAILKLTKNLLIGVR